LLTEAGEGGAGAVRAPAEAILELFGPDRVIWGSDWPVVNLAGDHGGWFAQCRALVAPAHHDAVFGGNAAAVYRLDRA
ncbi:amidohydrolase family protein, partial [Methylobacterium platani]